MRLPHFKAIFFFSLISSLGSIFLASSALLQKSYANSVNYNSETCLLHIKDLIESFEYKYMQEETSLKERGFDLFELSPAMTAFSKLKKFLDHSKKNSDEFKISSYELLRTLGSSSKIQDFLRLLGNIWARVLIVVPTLEDARRLELIARINRRDKREGQISYLVIGDAFFDENPLIYLHAKDQSYTTEALSLLAKKALLVSYPFNIEKKITLLENEGELHFEYAIADRDFEKIKPSQMTSLERLMAKEKRVFFRSPTGFFTSHILDPLWRTNFYIFQQKTKKILFFRHIIFVRHIEEAFYLESLASPSSLAFIVLPERYLHLTRNLIKKNLQKTNANNPAIFKDLLKRKLPSFTNEGIQIFDGERFQRISFESFFTQEESFDLFYSVKDDPKSDFYTEESREFFETANLMYLRSPHSSPFIFKRNHE